MGEKVLDLRKALTLLFVFALTSAGLIFLHQSRLIAGPESVLARVTAPIQGVVNQGARGIGDLTRTFQDVQELRHENEQLRDAVAHLTDENVQLEELKRENARLRQALGFQRAYPSLIGLPAEVIGRDPTSLLQYILVDKGSKDGVKAETPVVSPAGLVGRVVEVNEERSKVLLLIDVSSSAPAMIQNSRADGIVEGRWQLGGRLTLRYIPQGVVVKTGDMVITSGLGGTFPKGLTIGQVTSVRQNDVEMLQEADVVPIVNFSGLESVTIIVGQRK